MDDSHISKVNKSLLSKAEAPEGKSNLSKISRSTNGRFEAKYKVGDKAANGSLIKEIKEEDWKFVARDNKGNSYYKCLKCVQALRVLKSDRKKHSCKHFKD